MMYNFKKLLNVSEKQRVEFMKEEIRDIDAEILKTISRMIGTLRKEIKP